MRHSRCGAGLGTAGDRKRQRWHWDVPAKSANQPSSARRASPIRYGQWSSAAKTATMTCNGTSWITRVPDIKLYTDDARVYRTLAFSHQAVNHRVGEYERGEAHTNAIGSFSAVLERA